MKEYLENKIDELKAELDALDEMDDYIYDEEYIHTEGMICGLMVALNQLNSLNK